MAAEAVGEQRPAGGTGPNHGLRIFVIWLPIAIVADILLYFVYGPHMPPGTMSTAAASQQFDIKVMSVMAAPVMAFVLVFAGYALVVWRHRDGDAEDGPPIYGHTRIQATWITVSSVIVLSLAAFGTYELAAPGFAGAGAGEGPSPIWKPVQFNVTSLDVIHGFWAYQLGVKADANPGVNNVAYTTPTHTGQFTVRCAELCGLWHGAMFNFGQVESVADFQSWATATEAKLASVTAMLPAYSTVYDPTVIPQINKAMAKGGIAGANGYYYPPNDPVQP